SITTGNPRMSLRQARSPSRRCRRKRPRPMPSRPRRRPGWSTRTSRHPSASPRVGVRPYGSRRRSWSAPPKRRSRRPLRPRLATRSKARWRTPKSLTSPTSRGAPAGGRAGSSAASRELVCQPGACARPVIAAVRRRGERMKSRWVESDAEALVAQLAKLGPDLALRVYSTRLLGQDPALVLHGGGNTSLKTRMPDLVGDETEVLCVKGSGYDMAAIEPSGLPAVRLEPLRRLRSRETLSDEELVRVQRASLIDPAAPTPSVASLLHAFLPHRFVDHTHASAVLSLVDQPDGADICAEVYDGRMAFVPYLKPGFGLARKAAELYDAKDDVEGLILSKHGLFTFGASAREAYERMIEMVTLAEERLTRRRNSVFVARTLPGRIAAYAEIAPILRGACSLNDPVNEGAWQRFILEVRTSPAILDFVSGSEVMRYSQAGPVVSDHVIRIKGWPLVVPPPAGGQINDFARDARAAARAY